MKMVKFESQFRPHKRVLTNSGSREKILYTARYGPDGVLELVEDGKENLYEYIQSHRDSVDIHVLLKRYQNGEKDVFERVQGFYGDVADIPNNFIDTLNAVLEAERIFAGLPAEIRAKFNGNSKEFIASFSDPDKIRSVFGDSVVDKPAIEEPVTTEPAVKEEPKE